MKYFCKELNRTFTSKPEMFKALRDNKDIIIAEKKASILKSCKKGLGITAKSLDYSKLSTQTKGITFDDNYYYIAVNSTRILDAHSDLHIDGLWNKTITDRQGKNYLVADHRLELLATIARKEHVQMFTAIVPFSLIGKPYDGDTEVLIYKVRKDKIINVEAKAWLDSGDAIEASVRMQYVDIVFALDSEEKEDVKYKDNYDELIKLIANKDDFENDILYFWGIKQAKNVFESSLVLFGSNHATGQLDNESKSNDVICQQCSNEFDYLSVKESGMGYVECPGCKAIVTQQMKHQPPEGTGKDNEPPEGTQKTWNELLNETNFLNS